MKLGVFTVLLAKQSLDEALAYLKGLGVEAVEIGCGGFPGTAHCDAVKFLKDQSLIKQFQETIKKHGMMVSALSVHGNPVHPQPEIAAKFHQEFEAAVQLAAELEIDTVVTFSGCPGDSEDAKYPNWVTCPWPDDFLKILKWQWEERLIPYWQKTAEFTKKYGVNKIALELHPGFCVYNPETLLRLRAAVGDIIGANLDPSHLFWQGIDPVAAIRELKGPSIISMPRIPRSTFITPVGMGYWIQSIMAMRTKVLALPHGWLRTRRRDLAGDLQRIATGRVRSCYLH